MPEVTNELVLVTLQMQVEIKLPTEQDPVKQPHGSPVVRDDVGVLHDALVLVRELPVGNVFSVADDVLGEFGIPYPGPNPFFLIPAQFGHHLRGELPKIKTWSMFKPPPIHLNHLHLQSDFKLT